MRKIFAYTRVSTPLGKNLGKKETQKQREERQNMDRQNVTLEKYAADNGFTIDEWVADYLSGATPYNERPGYTAMRGKLRPGDIIVMTDLDRIGRDTDSIEREMLSLKDDGVLLAILDIPFLNDWSVVTSDDKNSMYSITIKIFLDLKSWMAQQEREKIQARINQGLDAARANGVRLGRKPTGVPKSFEKEYRQWKGGTKYSGMNVTEFAKVMGVARPTVYKYAKILEAKENPNG